MRSNLDFRVSVLMLAAIFAPGVSSAADFSWTFDLNGAIDYRLTAVSSTSVYGGALPANDPTINLVIGKSYQISFPFFLAHPVEIIARGGTPASDVVVLAQGSTVGTMEADAGVAWNDNGAGLITFTVTQRLLSALRQGGRNPGYRCEVHTADMRGSFNVTSPPFNEQWTFSTNGLSDYRLTSVSSTQLFGGPLPADDATITLLLGRRYRVTNTDGVSHPLQIAGLGASSGLDNPLLALGPTFFTLEDNPDIAWFDNGAGILEFTLTLNLFNAMSASGLAPGYRCEAHPDDMRGFFVLQTPATDWVVYE